MFDQGYKNMDKVTVTVCIFIVLIKLMTVYQAETC